eukprot:5078716-Ditylum_brightwellii.AAC.1
MPPFHYAKCARKYRNNMYTNGCHSVISSHQNSTVVKSKWHANAIAEVLHNLKCLTEFFHISPVVFE